LKAHNDARTNPKSLIPDLQVMLQHFGTGNDTKLLSMPGQTPVMTNEGSVPIVEAITFLNTTTPVDALKWD
jgi:hypothetical protein